MDISQITHLLEFILYFYKDKSFDFLSNYKNQ